MPHHLLAGLCFLALLLTGCHSAPEDRSLDDGPTEPATGDRDIRAEVAQRNARVRAWHARLPERWRAPLEEHIDPESVAGLVARLDAFPDRPEVEVRSLSPTIAIGEDGKVSENGPEMRVVETYWFDATSQRLTFRLTASGRATLAEWFDGVRPRLHGLREDLDTIRKAPRTAAIDEDLGAPSGAECELSLRHLDLHRTLTLFAFVLEEDRISGGIGAATRKDLAREIAAISDAHLALLEQETHTSMDHLVLGAFLVRRISRLPLLLPHVEVSTLERWAVVPRSDLADLYRKSIRGEFTRAFLRGLATYDAPQDLHPMMEEMRNDDFAALLRDHPAAIDPIETIDRFIEIADICHDRLVRGLELPFPPPPWLDEVLEIWPADAATGEFFSDLPDWPGWEPRGAETLDVAAERLSAVPNVQGRMIAGIAADLAQDIVRRFDAPRFRAGPLAFAAASACALHERRVGTFPRTWREVVASGALLEIPIDPCSPDGAPLTLDAALRTIRSVGEDEIPGPLPPPLHNLDLEWFSTTGTPIDEDEVSTDDIVIEIPPLVP